MVRFFLYEKVTGKVFLILSSAPSNDDYLTSGEIWHAGQRVANGVHWKNVGVWENSDGVDLDESRSYVYDVETNELTDVGESEFGGEL